MLTPSNYRDGFLVDDDFLAGVSDLDLSTGGVSFMAYVLNQTSGEIEFEREYPTVPEAIAMLQGIQNRLGKKWNFEKIGCAGGCSIAGVCKKEAGSCGKGDCCPKVQKPLEA